MSLLRRARWCAFGLMLLTCLSAWAFSCACEKERTLPSTRAKPARVAGVLRYLMADDFANGRSQCIYQIEEAVAAPGGPERRFFTV